MNATRLIKQDNTGIQVAVVTCGVAFAVVLAGIGDGVQTRISELVSVIPPGSAPGLDLRAIDTTLDDLVFYLSLGSLVSTSMIVGLVSYLSTRLRSYQIAVLRIQGVAENDLWMRSMRRALTMSLWGGSLGVTLGYVLALLMRNQTDIPVTIQVGDVARVAILAVVLTLAMSGVMSWLVIRADPSIVIRRLP